METNKTEEKPFLKPEEALAALRKLVPEDSPDSKPVRAEAIKRIIYRVLEKDLTDDNITAAIIEALQTYKDNNPDGEGIPAAQLWTYLRRGGEQIPLQIVETVISDLLKVNRIHTVRGAFTTYKIGGDPNKEAATTG